MAYEKKETTYSEGKQDAAGVKPPTGTPNGGSLGTNIVTPQGSIISGDPVASSRDAMYKVDPEKSRIGDYTVNSKGQTTVVPNSLTDYAQKYLIMTGASKKQGLKPTDWANAAANAIGAYLGAPTKSGNAAELIGTGVVSSVAKGVPVLRGIWSALTFADTLQQADNAYLEAWLNQPVTIDYAFDIKENDDGTRSIVINPDKMDLAGYGSGRGVLEATDTSKTSVSFDGKKGLNVMVSEAFASSDNYEDIVKTLKEAFPNGLTEEEANRVVDEESGTTQLQAIQRYIEGEETQFYYRAQSIANFKQIAPGASREALNEACDTQLIGGVKNKDLGGLTITIYNENDEKEEVNALEYLTKISEMDERGRDDYMLSLGNRIESDDISDDEKVILQAQANALYMASNNKDSGFKDMYRKDFMDTVADAGGIFTGVRLGNLFGISPELQTFETNEGAASVLTVATSVARMKAMSKITNKLEALERAGLQRLGNKIGNNAVGNFLQNINKFAPQDEASPIGVDSFGKWAGKTATQFALQASADLAYETGRMAVYAAADEDFDFLDELKTDMIIDALVTYGPNAYVDIMNSDKYEYRKIDGESKLVKLTADELAARRANQIDKLTNSKAALKNQELAYDKNAAMSKLAVQIRSVVKGSNTLYRKMLRVAGDIRQLTQDVTDEFFSNKEVSKHYSDFKQKLNVVTENGKTRKFTKADANYINAKANKERFLAEFADDKEKKKKIGMFYKEHINGVSKQRAAQLDELMASMKVIYSDIFAYYKQKGLISDEEYKKITESPAYKDGNYFPVWSSKHKFKGGEISQTRKATKDMFDKERSINIEEFDHPLTTFGQYLNNQMRNIAINERAMTILEAASVAGVKIHATTIDKKALKDVKGLLKYNSEFKAVYDKVVADVRKRVPTQEQWQADNADAILKSHAMRNVESLGKTLDEGKALRNRLRREQRAKKKLLDSYRKPLAEGETVEQRMEKLSKANEDIDLTRFEIAMNKASQRSLADALWWNTRELMADRAKKNTWSPAKLDEESYANVELMNNIKKALKSDNVTGELQIVINRAVEAANPYVSQEDIIDKLAGEEAAKFRKRVYRDLKEQYKNNKTKLDMANELADKITDKVLEKILKNTESSKLPEAEGYSDDRVAKVLTTYDSDNPKTIRFFTDGEEHYYKLEGAGAEELVREFYAPEMTAPKNLGQAAGRGLLKAGNAIARAKRTLTTGIDKARVLPNFVRDWSRGIVTTGGRILLSPDMLRTDAIESGNYSDEDIAKIDAGFKMARQAISRSTFTQSLEAPKKNRPKDVIKAATEPDGNAFTRHIWEWKNKSLMAKASTLNDFCEEYTRKRAMDTAYYDELAKATARGESIDEAVKSATEAAYFYGREATTNFMRRGKIVSAVATQVPYLSQKFSTLESAKFAYLDNPIAVSRSLKTTVTAYAAAIAIALSNDESRKRYYLLTEYDRANNIIIPLDNGSIVTIPLDETVAAFLTPYRRMIETLNGVDPEAFYLWGVDFLEALSPADLSGFSEGDKFNIRRGLEKYTAQHAPTWLLPLLENHFGRDFYYGSDIKVDEAYTEAYYDNPNPTPGEMTTNSKRSKILGAVSEATGIPQWKLQNIWDEYGGNVGQYALNTLDKLAGATEEEQGGKEFADAIFKPFTGSDSNQAQNDMWTGINRLNDEKKTLQKKLKEIDGKLEAAVGTEKANLEADRQKLIEDYGTRVSDFLTQYLSAYELTGGLSQVEANRIYWLYDIHGDSNVADTYAPDSIESYYNDKIVKDKKKRATNLAAASGFDKYVGPRMSDATGAYFETYGKKAFENTLYGYGSKVMGKVADVLESYDDYNTSYVKLKKDAQDKYYAYIKAGDYDAAEAIAYEYDEIILKAALPILQEMGGKDALNNNAVLDYLGEWIIVPSSEMKTAKGTFVPKLPEGAEKDEAFKKYFIKKMYGVEQ